MPEVPTSPANRRRAGVRRRVIAGAGLLAVVLLLGFGVFPQEPLRRHAEARLRAAVGPEARLGELRVTPFFLRAEIRDLYLEGPGYALTVPEVRVVLAPGALRGALALQSLEVQGPTLRLTPTGEPDTAEKAAHADLPPVTIEAVTIRDASVHWSDAGTGYLVIEGLTADGAIGRETLTIDAQRGAWRGETTILLGPARARLAVTRELDIVLESLEARSGESTLSARGPLAQRGIPALGVELDASLDLTGAGQTLELAELSGTLGVTGRVEGPVDRLQLTLDARGTAGWTDWPIDELKVHLEAQPDARRVEVLLGGGVLGGHVEAEARLDGDTTSGRFAGRGLDLARLPAGMRPSLNMTDGEIELSWEGPLEGPLHVDLVARGRGRVEDAKGHLEARARGTVQPRDGTADLEWSAGLRGEASTPITLGLQLDTRGRLLGAWPPEVTGRVSGTLTPPDGPETALAGTFRAHGTELHARIDTRGLLDLAGELEVRDGTIQELSLVAEPVELARFHPRASGRVRLEARAAGPLLRPDLSVLLSAVGLEWDGVSLGRLEVAAEGTAERAEVRAALPDLAIGGQGDLLLGQELRLRGQVEFHETALAVLAPLLGFAEPLGGHLTATLGFDAALAELAEAEATLDVAELEAVFRDRSLRAEPFRAQLRDGRLGLQDVRIEGEGLSLDLSASTALGQDEAVEVRAWFEADLGALPLPEGWSLAGTLGGAIGLAGTRARPSFEGALHAADVAVSGPSVPDVEVDDVELYLDDGGLRVPRFAARVGTGRATLEGEIPYGAVWTALRGPVLSDAHHARVSASWENVPVSPFEGGLAGELSLEGGLATIEGLKGELRLPAQRLSFEGLALETQPATLRLENGRVTTEGLIVRSGRGDLVVAGVADLLAETLDVSARGGFALGLLSPFLKEGSIGGSAEVELRLTGPLAAPVPSGSLTLDGVSVRWRALPQAVTGIRGRVDLDGTTAVLAATGDFGGGSLGLAGEARATGADLGDSWFQLTGRNVALRYPPGLRSRLDVDLTLAGRPGDFALVGNVAVQGGAYELDAAVREALRAPAPSSPTSDFLRDVALDVTVDLARPVVVQSSFGRLEATGRINARGDLQEPTPFGRLDVRRGGRIEVQGRDLTVTGGAIAFSGSWNADLSLNGETVVSDVEFNDGSSRDVRVRASLQGSVEQPSLVLSSEPTLSRQEIVSVIATGRLQSSLVDSSAWLLGGQAATLMSGQLTRRVAQTFGLDEIVVRPDLVARDTDPSARFTFGKRIGRRLALVYSAGLGGPETRWAEMRVFPGYNVRLQALRTDLGTHELGLGQRFDFGGGLPDQPLGDSSVRLEEVRFEGAALDESLRRSVRLSKGKRVEDWRVQQEAEKLRGRLRKEGYLDAEVSARIDDRVALFTVEPGPVYGWRVEGMADPPDLSNVFARALFEADAVDLARSQLLRELGGRGHLRGEIDAATTGEGSRREIVFTARPGPRFDPVVVHFPGARALSRSALLTAVGGASGLFEKPETAVLGLQEAYRARHFLAARVGVPRVELRGNSASLTVPIEEGPPARLLWVRPEGATLPEGRLLDALSLPTGVPFSSATVTAAMTRVRTLYLSQGYTDVRVRPELVVEGDSLGLILHIREGERRVIESVTLSGNTRTRDWLVRRALELEKGQPLDPRRLGEAEQRLLQLGTFARSAIVPDPKEPGALRVDLQEAANLTAGYDLRWDDEVGWSGLVDGLASNLLGLGVGLGGRVRYGGDLRELRGSLHVPEALAAGDVTGSVFRTEEDIPADDFEIQRIQTGFQVQHSVGRPSRLEMLLGYRFRRNLTIAPTLPEVPIDVGGVDVSLLRTTQNDLLDPRRGAFWSLNLNLAPSWLGSDAPLVAGYAQGVLNRSFRDDAFTWAQSYRLGLAWGLDGEPVIASERFRAGGASSLRGFGTNEVGPRGFFGEPAGGEAVVIMNQELRYHHHSGFGLVGFYDVGNVFPTVDSMRFDLRQTLGAGLRWASPVGLLRVDLGIPLDRQPEEKTYRLFFGLGQAF